LKLVDIGLTEEGRHQYMMICSSPENIRLLEYYREISQRLARAKGLNDQMAMELADKGKAVVWIDGGLHASEALGFTHLIEAVWRYASGNDPETLRILRDVIILFTHDNPDGQELISSWYMRRLIPAQRIYDVAPRLFEKYAGHDNNRDFYMGNLKETQNINRQLYLNWFPQIVYNIHQPGPSGTILSCPPYRDPFNYALDPLVITSVNAVGEAMQSRLNAEGKGGVTSRDGAPQDSWWSGGLRNAAYFHNMIGILTEISGNPTPMEIPFVPSRQVPSEDLPLPIKPQLWHFRQSLDYQMTLDRAILDYAVRHRDELLFRIYRMGRNSIDRGSRDNWTLRPGLVTQAVRLYQKEANGTSTGEAEPPVTVLPASLFNLKGLPPRFLERAMSPEARDAREFIIPSDQGDFPTAVRFVNSLILSGVAVERATSPFTVRGRTYPSQSYIVKTDQAFRPVIIDMFEPQDYPDEFKFSGGPPIPPNDISGWTLAMQMGVKFDRLLEPSSGTTVELPYGELQRLPPGLLTGRPVAGYIVGRRINNSFLLINRLLRAHCELYWVRPGESKDSVCELGDWYVPTGKDANAMIEKAAIELGIKAVGLAEPPKGELHRVGAARIGLWDQYGGNISSGWTRWVLEKFEYDFSIVFAQEIDAGHLRDRFDVIIFAPGAIPPIGPPAAAEPSWFGREPDAEALPTEYRPWLGTLTAAKSIPRLKEFLDDGGTIIAIGSSTRLAAYWHLPLKDPTRQPGPMGEDRQLPRNKFSIPGSLLRVQVDQSAQLAFGMEKNAVVFFDNSPVFRLQPDARRLGITPVVWFASDAPLSSGWALGQELLQGGAEALDVTIGAGRLCLLAPEVTFRGESDGCFKLLFNGLYCEKSPRGL
jgi:hypothetical protein